MRRSYHTNGVQIAHLHWYKDSDQESNTQETLVAIDTINSVYSTLDMISAIDVFVSTIAHIFSVTEGCGVAARTVVKDKGRLRITLAQSKRMAPEIARVYQSEFERMVAELKDECGIDYSLSDDATLEPNTHIIDDRRLCQRLFLVLDGAGSQPDTRHQAEKDTHEQD